MTSTKNSTEISSVISEQNNDPVGTLATSDHGIILFGKNLHRGTDDKRDQI